SRGARDRVEGGGEPAGAPDRLDGPVPPDVLVGLAIARDDDLGLALVLADAPLELVGAGLPLGVTPLALARGGAAQGMEEALGNTLGIRCHRPSILEQMGAGSGNRVQLGKSPDRRYDVSGEQVPREPDPRDSGARGGPGAPPWTGRRRSRARRTR